MMEVLQQRNGPMEFRDSSHILVFGVGYPQPCTLRIFLGMEDQTAGMEPTQTKKLLGCRDILTFFVSTF